MQENTMFKYEARAKQLFDFKHLSWGNIHPSDVDVALEVDGEKLILVELKLEGKEPDFGQKLLLERIANSWDKSGGKAMVIYAWHEQEDTNEKVDVGYSTIFEIYYKGKTLDYRHKKVMVLDVVEWFVGEELKRKLKVSNLRGETIWH